MALNPDVGAVLLPCGRDATEVWDTALSGTADHHREHCPYCAAVVAQCRQLAGVTDDWRAQPAPPPPALVERAMMSVRSEVQHRFDLHLSSAHGPVRIDAAAVATVLRRAVDSVGGVRARSCRIRPRPDDDLVDIELSIVVVLDRPIPDLAADVREAVTTSASRDIGFLAGGVDISVVDLVGLP